MNTTLTVIENFSDHYLELTNGVDLNIGGNLAPMVAVMVVLLIIAVATVIIMWSRPLRFAREVAVIAAMILIAIPVYVVSNNDAKVATTRFFTPDNVTDAYDEMMAEVGDSERLAHRVGQDVHRFMPVGNAAIESREVVCGQGDNDRSLLCGGSSMTSIVYEVESHDDDSHDPLSLLVMTPNMEYHEDDDQVWVTVAVEFMAR